MLIDKHLLEVHSGIDRPNEVVAVGDLELTMPGLEVDGIGTVNIPLSELRPVP